MIWNFTTILLSAILAKIYPELKKSRIAIGQILIAFLAGLLFVDTFQYRVYFDKKIFLTMSGIFLLILLMVFLFHFDAEEATIFHGSLMFGGAYVFRDLFLAYSEVKMVALVSVYAFLMLALYSLWRKDYSLAAWLFIPIASGVAAGYFLPLSRTFFDTTQLLAAYRVLSLVLVGIYFSDFEFIKIFNHKIFIIIILKLFILPTLAYVITSSIFNTASIIYLLTLFFAIAPSPIITVMQEDSLSGILFTVIVFGMIFMERYGWAVFFK